MTNIPIAPPRLAAPGPDDHKYTRGKIVVVAGAMPGAGALAAHAAARAGAGYVVLLSKKDIANLPHAIVQSADTAHLDDPRTNAIVIGPGLGRDDAAAQMVDAILSRAVPIVVDGDALHLVTPEQLARRHAPTVLTPHAGEYAALFGGRSPASAATLTKAVIIAKGAQTIIAAPDGRQSAMASSSDLATAGTGDVLSGVVATMLAQLHDAFDAACAAVWLHQEAARIAGPGLMADDLLPALRTAMVAAR